MSQRSSRYRTRGEKNHIATHGRHDFAKKIVNKTTIFGIVGAKRLVSINKCLMMKFMKRHMVLFIGTFQQSTNL